MIVFISYDRDSVKMPSADHITPTGAQVRAARALLRWSAEDLAKYSRLGTATIRRAEANDGPISSTSANVAAVIKAFEEAGVVFIFENGIGVGVKMVY